MSTPRIPNQDKYLDAFEAVFGGLCPEVDYQLTPDGAYGNEALQRIFIGWHMGRVERKKGIAKPVQGNSLLLPLKPSPGLLAPLLLMNPFENAHAQYASFYHSAARRVEYALFDARYEKTFGEPARESRSERYRGKVNFSWTGWQGARTGTPDVIEICGGLDEPPSLPPADRQAELLFRALRHQAAALKLQYANAENRLRVPRNLSVAFG
jgi:hypothetical protein